MLQLHEPGVTLPGPHRSFVAAEGSSVAVGLAKPNGWFFVWMVVVCVASGALRAGESDLLVPLPGQQVSDPARRADVSGPAWPSDSSSFQAPDPAARLGPPQYAYPADTAPRGLSERTIESGWYTRIDYFHWNERLDQSDFVNEYGPLSTLGYTRRVGPERFRAELFGGTVYYLGAAQFDDGTTEPLDSTTNYLGLRGEYEVLIEPAWWPAVRLLLGIGSRFWFRDLRDDVTDSGAVVMGYRESWWTFYPYAGIETKRPTGTGPAFFGAGRIGFTPLTYERVSWFDVTLYPQCGIMGQLEGGLRWRRLDLSAYFEAMTWGQSAVVREIMQPASRMYTVGLKAGLSF